MYTNLVLRGDSPRNYHIPLTLIYIGNGCEGYSTNTYIPSKYDLTSELDTSIRHEFFVGFNALYYNMASYGIWYELKLETLNQKQKDLFRIILLWHSNGIKSFKEVNKKNWDRLSLGYAS